MNKKVYFIVNK